MNIYVVNLYVFKTWFFYVHSANDANNGSQLDCLFKVGENQPTYNASSNWGFDNASVQSNMSIFDGISHI